MQLFYQTELPTEGSFVLSEEEAHHLLKVLRQQKGDTFWITDGKGAKINGQITEPTLKKCIVQVLDYQMIHQNKNYMMHLAVAPTKNIDRMEWLVEKCTEIGIDKISFFQADHSERSYLNLDRLVKKSIAALKQSAQYWLPHLAVYQSFGQLMSQIVEQQRFIAYVDHQNPDHLFQVAQSAGSVCVLIGPEGDFSAAELQLALSVGFQKVSLGNTRLRTETAGIAACHAISLKNWQA